MAKKKDNNEVGQPKIGHKDQPQSDIRAAIIAVQQAQDHLAAFSRERTARQLSVSALSSVSRDLHALERRLSVYAQD